MASQHSDRIRQPSQQGRDWFAWTYPMAYLAIHVSFIPLFALLLPRKVELLAGTCSLTVLSWILLSGAITASIAHIGAGHLGDRWLARFGSRRGLIAIGLCALAASFTGLTVATNIGALMAAIIAYQIALNITFAPLGALLSDYVPDHRTGAFAGWLNAALPVASILTAILAAQFPDHHPAAFWLTLAVIVGGTLPLLVFWPKHRPVLAAERAPQSAGAVQVPKGDFAIVWFSRFFIQFGAAIMLGYLFTFLSNLEGQNGFPATATAAMGTLSLVAAGVGVFAAVIAGHLSDLARRRIWPIAVGGLLTSIALAVLAWSEHWLVFAAAYGLFHLGIAAFLAVDSALVAQLVRGNRHRGTYLGILNLTNTFPGIVGPVLTLAALAELSDASALRSIFVLASVLALIASVLIFRVRSVQ